MLNQGIERNYQHVPVMPEETAPLASSIPLHGLSADAPDVYPDVHLEDVRYSISNDEAAAYYDQTRSRTLLPEYREATNRTAVLVGEGSLMAALPMIPEDTIVLVDQNPEMVAFMAKYVRALRRTETLDEWGDMMGLGRPGYSVGSDRVLGRLSEQALEWVGTGYNHPFMTEDFEGNDEAFAEASKLARRKAIIPWQADLENRRDVKRLGKALEEHGANVTMMNITNIAGGRDVAVEGAPRLAKRLNGLPLTPNAPILASAYRAKPPAHEKSSGFIVEAVGPFFGLDNLAQHGKTPLQERPFPEDNRNALEEVLGPILMDLLGASVDFDTGRQYPRGVQVVSLSLNGSEMIDLDSLPPDVQAIVKSQFRL